MDIITIDKRKWITPKEYGQIVGISAPAVCKRMKQKAYEKKIFIVPELGLKLIQHPDYKKGKK